MHVVCLLSVSQQEPRPGRHCRCGVPVLNCSLPLGLHVAPGWKSVCERFTVMHVWVMHNRVCCVVVMSVK